MTELQIIQPMPDLSAEQLDALRTDIAENGIQQPVVIDQHGRIIDGNNRVMIATELGIEYPTTTVIVTDDDDAHDRAVTLNCARRHLTREQRRELIAAEIQRRPDNSDRAIARRVGCSPSTVGAVRNSEVSKLDSPTMTKAEAEEITERTRQHLRALKLALFHAAYLAGSNGIAPTLILRHLLAGRRTWEAEELLAPLAHVVFDEIIDEVLDPATLDEWRPHFSGPEFAPLDADEIDKIFSVLADPFSKAEAVIA